MRTEYVAENLSAKGAYELAAAEGGAAKVTIFASGSEIEIALDARDLLQKDGTPTRVVSVPCFELFEEQGEAYREKVLGNAPVKIAVEAALFRFGWDRFVGSDGAFVGMTGFGASAPAKDLYKYFGITAEAVATIAGERGQERRAQGRGRARHPQERAGAPSPPRRVAAATIGPRWLGYSGG